MKHNNFSQDQNQKPAGASRPTAPVDLNPNEIDFALSSDEAARRASLSYVNLGSLPGYDVLEWLKAEKQLLAEHNLTRVHGFHDHT